MKNKTYQEDYLIDFQFIETKKMIGDIQLWQVGKTFCNKDTYISPHLHINFFEFTVVLNGKGKIYTNDDKEYIPVSQGDIYLSFPTDIHAIESDEKQPLQYSFLSFILEGSSFNETYKSIMQDFYPYNKRVFRDHNVAFLIELFLSEIMRESYKQTEVLFDALHALLHLTARHFLSQPPTPLPANVSKKEKLCYLIMQYIDANLLSIQNFADISKYFNYNYSYLSHVFTQTTNTTILEYLSQRKLERAKLLIQENKLSLTQIAEILHYSSLYSFSKSFKYHFGMSPTAFKKLNRRKDS